MANIEVSEAIDNLLKSTPSTTVTTVAALKVLGATTAGDASIVAADLAPNAVTSDKILAGAVTATKITDAALTIAKTSGLQTALDNKVDDSQLSITGGVSKVMQAASNADFTTGAFANNDVILDPGGNIIFPDKRGIRFLKRDGSFSGQSIFGWDEHGGSPDTPELLLESKGSNGVGTVALVAYGGIQIGPNDAGRYARGVNFVSGAAQNISGFNMMPSGAAQFQNSVHNGSTVLSRQMGIQTHALDTTNTNSVMRVYDNSVMTTGGTPSTAGRGDLTGTVIAEVYKDGIWSQGTAPASVLLDATTPIQVCSKYKSVQVARLNLVGNRTLTITGAIAGMRGVIYVTQDATGNRTLTLPTQSITETGFALTTTGERADRLEWEFDGTNYFWTIKKGFDLTYAIVDADAQLYVNAVVAAGITVSSGRKSAIDTFILAEKAASRWTSHKRIIFPIWANASANAIDMKTLATGTFVNSPTHASGYVQGNGSTQYFDVGATPSALGMTMSSAGATILMPANTSSNGLIPFGTNSGGGQFSGYYDGSGAYFTAGSSQSAVGTITTSDRLGIFCFNRVGTTMETFRRKTAGFTTLASSTVGSSGAIPTVQNVYLMASNSLGTPTNYWNGQIGAFAIHSGFGSSDATAFTSNLKTLWETCSGLTLP